LKNTVEVCPGVLITTWSVFVELPDEFGGEIGWDKLRVRLPVYAAPLLATRMV
jgi:hypothetical protein